jgi:hypothetical protein
MKHPAANQSQTKVSPKLPPHDGSNPRDLVERLNHMILNMNVEGIKKLASEHPRETIEAANYVDSKFKFAVQEIVSSAIQERRN